MNVIGHRQPATYGRSIMQLGRSAVNFRMEQLSVAHDMSG